MTLTFEHIAKRYGEKTVFEDLNLMLPDQGIIGISAPSGTGKTTLLKMAAGLIAPDSGQVIGRPAHISMIFEDDVLLPWLSAVQNVELAGTSATDACVLLGELGLGACSSRMPDELSGGQKRRVALARALARPQAKLFLLDEPTIRLDATAAALALDAIDEHCKGGLALVASHDSSALSHCDTVIELELRR